MFCKKYNKQKKRKNVFPVFSGHFKCFKLINLIIKINIRKFYFLRKLDLNSRQLDTGAHTYPLYHFIQLECMCRMLYTWFFESLHFCDF